MDGQQSPKCRTCEADISHRGDNAVYCEICMRARTRRQRKGRHELICARCGKSFRSEHRQPYCSHRCGSQAAAARRKLEGWGTPVCSVECCDRPSNSGGICTTHWRRMNRAGTYAAPNGRKPDNMSVLEWFMSKVDKGDGDGCWLWQGQVAVNRGGYGVFYDAEKGKKIRAHHFLVPPLPTQQEAGVKMEYDHLCRNPLCVRPDHLEMVTAAENRRRALEVRHHGHEGQGITNPAGFGRRVGDAHIPRCLQARAAIDAATGESNLTNCAEAT